MHGIHTHIPETNPVSRGYIVAAILFLLFMVPVCIVYYYYYYYAEVAENNIKMNSDVYIKVTHEVYNNIIVIIIVIIIRLKWALQSW